jgi:hypothetical protein
MTFAKRVFQLAGIYGLIVMPPLYLAEVGLMIQGQPLLERPETHYGFVGVTLVFQLIFLTIARDPSRYRPLMPLCVLEKLVFALAVWPLFLVGRAPAFLTVFATIDLVLAALFVAAWRRTPA